MNYFNIHNTPQENKELYKAFCKQLHPDMATGNEAAFIEMKKQYDAMLELQSNPKKTNDKGEFEYYKPSNYYTEAEKIFDKSAEVLKQEARETLKNAGINTIEDLIGAIFKIGKKRK
jgi:DnaJ-class molecular chaperone